MKFSAVSTDFYKALSRIISVVPTKSALPVLEHILIELYQNDLRLTASDLEVSMTVSHMVNGIEDGRIAVPAKKLSETLRSLPSTDVLFDADIENSKIILKTDQGEYRMSGEFAANFPETAHVEEIFSIDLETDLLKNIIGKTSFAVSNDDLRPSMKGVLFQWKAEEFRAVATDGHRLVQIKHRGALSEANTIGDREVILPAKTLNLVMRSIDGVFVTVVFGKSTIKFTINDLQLTSRIIDERYPNYESVIPLDNEKCLEVNRQAFVSAIQRCSIFSNVTTNQIRMAIHKDEVKISAEDIDFGGEAKEIIPCKYNTEEELDMGFNARYISEAMAHLDSEDVQLFFSTPTRAGVIRPKNHPKDLDILMIVMPLRLNA